MSVFTDALINKISPDEQISALILPNDLVAESEMGFAEQIGNKVSEAITGSTLVTAPIRFTDITANPFSIADIGRYIVIRAGANVGTYRIITFVSVSAVDLENTNGTSPTLVTQTAINYAIHNTPSLESTMNHMLTQLRGVVDPAGDWFQNMPRAFDPTNTDGANIKNEKMSMKTVSDNWYGAHTKILDIVTTNITVATGNTGKLFLTSLTYADPIDRRGLVIQSSLGNAYQDEVALASITLGKHKVTLVDVATGNEFKNAASNLVYGVLQDGADNIGVGEGTDVFIKFVEDVAGVPTNYTWAAGDPTSIQAYMPNRKRRTEMLEFDERRFLIAGIVGDAEQAQDIAEVRAALGLADGQGAGGFGLTNTTAFFPFSELTLATATMEDIVNKLNEEIGNRNYTLANFVTDGQTLTQSIEVLDLAIGAASGVKSKVIERITVELDKGVAHTIPFATGSNPAIASYLLDTGNRGLNMDVFVAGKKLIPDSSAGNTDGEYEETTNVSVTFRFKVKKGQIVEYVIKDNV